MNCNFDGYRRVAPRTLWLETIHERARKERHMGQSCTDGFRHRFLAILVGTLLVLGGGACTSSGSSSSSSTSGPRGGPWASGGLCSNTPSGPIKIANIEP